MLNRNKFLLFSLLILSARVCAQENLHVFTGNVTEKSFNEVILFKSVNGKTEKVADYVIDPTHQNFSFAFTFDANATYKLGVQRFKPGHHHLEFDKRFSIPLKMDSSKPQSISITPSQLDSTGKSGFIMNALNEQQSLSFVKGHVINPNLGGTLTLERVLNGTLVRITGSNIPKSNGEFSLAIPVKSEGFFYLTTPGSRTRIYLKPNDDLDLNIDTRTGKYDIVKGSGENKLLQKWYQLSLPITDYGYYRALVTKDSINLSNYLDKYRSLQPAIFQFEQKNKSSNEKFNQLLSTAISVDNGYAPIYLSYCLTKKNSRVAFSTAHIDTSANIKEFVNRTKIQSANIMMLGEGKNYLDLYCKYAATYAANGKKLSKADELRVMLNAIPNDTLKEIFLENKLGEIEIRNLSEFKTVFGPYAQDKFSPDVKEKYTQVYNQFAGDTVWIGKSSYDFSLPDSTGKIVSMKNFKGKVVLVDVWATWCGPCKGEMPFLKSIEEEYKNKDIVFVAISIDQAKDKQKWVNYIQKENLGGVHLFDDKAKTFGKKYNVFSVPRYMLIDKKGNWIEVRCPNPSSTEDLKQYIDEALSGS